MSRRHARPSPEQIVFDLRLGKRYRDSHPDDTSDVDWSAAIDEDPSAALQYLTEHPKFVTSDIVVQARAIGFCLDDFWKLDAVTHLFLAVARSLHYNEPCPFVELITGYLIDVINLPPDDGCAMLVPAQTTSLLALARLVLMLEPVAKSLFDSGFLAKAFSLLEEAAQHFPTADEEEDADEVLGLDCFYLADSICELFAAYLHRPTFEHDYVKPMLPILLTAISSGSDFVRDTLMGNLATIVQSARLTDLEVIMSDYFESFIGSAVCDLTGSYQTDDVTLILFVAITSRARSDFSRVAVESGILQRLPELAWDSNCVERLCMIITNLTACPDEEIRRLFLLSPVSEFVADVLDNGQFSDIAMLVGMIAGAICAETPEGVAAIIVRFPQVFPLWPDFLLAGRGRLTEDLLDAIILLAQLLGAEAEEVLPELRRCLWGDEMLNAILSVAEKRGPHQPVASAAFALLNPEE
jgi:hypothetical protein